MSDLSHVGADKIYIRNGARFVGDIRALGIEIEDGGFICGKVDLSRHSAWMPDHSGSTDSGAEFETLTRRGR